MAQLGETLENADPSERYISPDRIIDASTCRYKDSTWFIHEMAHNYDSKALQSFVVTLTKSTEQVTIDDFGQFMQYNAADDSFSDIESNGSDRWSNNFLANVLKFFRQLIEVIKAWFTR